MRLTPLQTCLLVFLVFIVLLAGSTVYLVRADADFRHTAEMEQVHAANAAAGRDLIQRCDTIDIFHQFVALYHPEPASGVYYSLHDSSPNVMMLTKVDGRYQVSLSANVSLGSDGKYRLASEPGFMVEDSIGTLTVISNTGSLVGHGQIFHATEWNRFYESGGNFETLRVVDNRTR